MGQAASRFDQGELFRTQAIRDITDLDIALQRKEQLRDIIGHERAAQIEARPDTVIDGEGFRIAHAFGRWYGFFATVGTIVGGAGLYSYTTGAPGVGKKLLTTHAIVTVPAAFGMSYVYYNIFARIGGFNQQKWDEYRFARFCRQLRNAKYQQ